MQIYKAKGGETVGAVAQELGVCPIKLSVINETDINTRLPEGKELLVVTPTRTYSARQQDTVESVMRKFEISKTELFAMNPEMFCREKLYRGQILTVKQNEPRYGAGVTNGYLYRGYDRERLGQLMPYLNYVTVCSAGSDGVRLYSQFDDKEVLKAIRDNGKFPILRIYISAPPLPEEWDNFLNGAIVIAKSSGYRGISLGNTSCVKERDRFVLNAKKKMTEAELMLLTEGVLNENPSFTEYADASVLTYDKLHLNPIPSYEDGEQSAIKSYADSYDCTTTFIELPSFAYCEGKYVDKRTALKAADRHRRSYAHNDEGMYLTIEGRGREQIFTESLENTKAKLTSISELGFMGISFDISRIPLAEIIMFECMLKPIKRAVYFDSPPPCQGPM